MLEWIATKDELAADWLRMANAHEAYDPDIQGADLKRYNNATHPEHGGPETYRILYEHGDGPAKVLTPSPRFLYMLMRGDIVRHARVIRDDPETGRPVFEGTGELLPAMTEYEAIQFIQWRDVPRGCNNVHIITTADLPSSRMFRNAWRIAA